MCCEIFWKRSVPFVLAIWVGLFVANIFQRENLVENKQENPVVKFTYPKRIHSEKGTGSSGESNKGLPPFYTQNPPQGCYLETDAFRIISKPRPNYTDAARQNQVEGKVRLRVNFLSSGEIGSVLPINNLPDGLTEQAMAAARQIKFKPQNRNGKPISVIKIVEYNFTIY